MTACTLAAADIVRLGGMAMLTAIFVGGFWAWAWAARGGLYDEKPKDAPDAG